MNNSTICNPIIINGPATTRLPRAHRYWARTANSPRKEPAVGEAYKRIILSAEAHEDTNDWLKFFLESAGYEVLTTSTAIGTLRLARAYEFDLFLMGDLLPLRSSIDLTKTIRKFNLHTPLLFHSARAYPSDILQGLSAGAQAYLVKPCTPNQLLHSIARHINRMKAFVS